MALRTLCLALILLCLAAAAQAAPLTLARGGQTDYQIVISDRPSKPIAHAARELASFLEEISGARLAIIGEKQWAEQALTPTLSRGEKGSGAIFVGLSAAAKRVAPEVYTGGLGHDGFVIQTSGRNLLLIGGEPRGTLYAVYTFLESYLGCRWWTSTASTIPQRSTITIGAIKDRQVPVVEYRESFFHDAFDGDWAVRNKCNGQSERLAEEQGGKITYQGFVHTLPQMVPREKYFDAHPDWFQTMPDGTRTKERVRQLCMTNPEVRRFVVEKALEWLRGNPTADIISISQDDDPGYCCCPNCKAINDREGSPAGSLIEFVNAVAAEIHRVFPKVEVDTLAYQNTRKPPRHVRPGPGVVVRLCSIECDFARPMTAPTNKAFYDDLVGWGRICRRLYIWDYVTNFPHYLRPQPVVHVLAPNIRAFVDNGAVGLFEQGTYTTAGGDMAELKAWVIAKLLWNPKLDGDKLIDEFLRGYYGPAAPCVRQYIDAMHRDAVGNGWIVGCGAQVNEPFPSYQAMRQAEAAFAQGMKLAAGDPELTRRLQRAHLAVLYSWLWRPDLQLQAAADGFQWCEGNDPAAGAQSFFDQARSFGITQYSEGHNLDELAERLLGNGRTAAKPPAGLDGMAGVIDLQDNLLTPRRVIATPTADPTASDGVAVVMTGDGGEVNARLWFAQNPGWRQTKYRLCAVVKCDLAGMAGNAFNAGLYDPAKDEDVISKDVPAAAVTPGWQTVEIGTVDLKSFAQPPILWVGMVGNGATVKSVAVDRLFLAPAR